MVQLELYFIIMEISTTGIFGNLYLFVLANEDCLGSFHVKCGIFGFYNIKNEFNIIIKMKCLN